MKKALFLDRDGTINEDTNYLSSPEELVFVPGAVEGLKKFVKNSFILIVISNQAGVARGIFTEKDLSAIDKRFKEMLGNEGLELAASYYCVHHLEHGMGKYKIDCDCRKPKPGMILKAIEDFDIDVEASVFIGDKITDLQAAEAAGIPFKYLVKTGKGAKEAQKIFMVKNLKVCDNLNKVADDFFSVTRK